MNWCRGLVGLMLVLGAAPVVFAQIRNDGLSGADAHEDAPAQRKYLLGDWNGRRKQLLERGVDLDLQYVADHLWNIRSDKKARLADWNRVRGTVNVDLGKLTGAHQLYFHITGLWQAGGNLATYLGTIAHPSGIASVNTFRLDSY